MAKNAFWITYEKRPPPPGVHVLFQEGKSFRSIWGFHRLTGTEQFQKCHWFWKKICYKNVPEVRLYSPDTSLNLHGEMISITGK